MAGFTTSNTEHLIRSNVWTGQMKEILEDELLAMNYVQKIDFPDATTINIPSLGQAEVIDYLEGQAVRYTAMDTGNWTMTIDHYVSSATYITEKMKQDSFYMSQLVSAFVPKQSRAIMKAIEANILAIGPDGQTASNLNAINGANHRWVGSGTSETIDMKDFALARFALQKANVPLTNLIAIVDPSVEYKISTMSNILNLNMNPRWEGVISSGLTTGMKFLYNIFGFDVYVSQNLKSIGAETINGVSTTVGVANLFFSAAPGLMPIMFAMKQSPKVDSEWNKDMQRDEYVTTCRWGSKLYYPENMVVVITDTDQVS